MKYFLTIAASDNSGGAGIQRDLKVAYDLDYWGLSAITGITVQDSTRMERLYPVSAKILAQQIEKSIHAFPVTAVKIGAICSNENIVLIADMLRRHHFPIVVLDTVFAPTQGPEFIKSIKLFRDQLLPHVNIITPNKDELALLIDKEINDFKEAVKNAETLSRNYKCNIFLTGGHFAGNTIQEALICNGKTSGTFKKEKLNLSYHHGTGCTLSSALSCFVGKGDSMKQACQRASSYVTRTYRVTKSKHR